MTEQTLAEALALTDDGEGGLTARLDVSQQIVVADNPALSPQGGDTVTSAVTRLTDMGVEPFLLSSSLLGVLAQRLVRKLCTVCSGKGCDTFGPIGPYLVTSDEITDPQALEMWLDVNGQNRQHGSTKTMVFPDSFPVRALFYRIFTLVSYQTQTA